MARSLEISLRLLLVLHSDGGSRCERKRRTRPAITLLEASRFPDTFHGRSSASGVTSLIPLGENGEVLVGDKLGSLRIESLVATDVGQPCPTTARFCSGINGETNRPSPIFSLDLARDIDQIFSGAGDRYVSVWEWEDGNWFCVQKLGPHTGWVRDVLYNEKSCRLHSIGCNCIETWRFADDRNWEHEKKSQIESSPSDGATLSSDLLCLCKFNENFFFTGGVDGRVHVWDSTLMDSPVRSMSAHDGRVNAIEYTSGGLVCTAGNDGKLKCWKYNSREDRLEPVAEFDFGGSRITALSSVDLGGKEDHVFCGTNVGEVALLSLHKGSYALDLVTFFQIVQRPTIHSLCVTVGDEPDLWVGHSNGLSVFTLASFTNLESLT